MQFLPKIWRGNQDKIFEFLTFTKNNISYFAAVMSILK